jgi:hypothetical protein
MRSALHTASGYDLVPTQDETVLLARQSRIVCEINGHCARQMLQLIELLSSDAAMQHFALEVNCHGLAEFMLGRSLKWRNTPKLRPFSTSWRIRTHRRESLGLSQLLPDGIRNLIF